MSAINSSANALYFLDISFDFAALPASGFCKRFAGRRAFWRMVWCACGRVCLLYGEPDLSGRFPVNLSGNVTPESEIRVYLDICIASRWHLLITGLLYQRRHVRGFFRDHATMLLRGGIMVLDVHSCF